MILTMEDLKYLIANEGIALVKEGIEFKFEIPTIKRRLKIFFSGPFSFRRLGIFSGCFIEYGAENNPVRDLMLFPTKYIEDEKELNEFLCALNFRLSISPEVTFFKLKNLLERMANNEDIK